MENSNDSIASAAILSGSDSNIKVARMLPRCQICQQTYSFPGSSERYNQRLPVLLLCNHTICETCLCQAKPNRFMKCPTCDAIIPLNKKKTSDQFECNFYILGLVKHVTQFGDNANTIHAPSASSSLCGECSNPVADRRCLQCDSLYCHECFKKIHHFSKVLRSHQTLELVTTTKVFQHIPGPCDCAPGQQVNFYCETCNKAICSECKCHSHLLHDIKHLYERNVNTLKEIPAYIALLNQLEQLNELSIKTCDSTLQTEKVYAQKAIDDISNYFIDMHSSLQVAEQRLVKIVKDHYRDNHMKIQMCQENLKTNKGQIEAYMDKLKHYSRSAPYNLDLESLLQQISVFTKELPCDLTVFQSSHNPITFERPMEPLRGLMECIRVQWNEEILLTLGRCENISSPPHFLPSSNTSMMEQTNMYRSPIVHSQGNSKISPVLSPVLQVDKKLKLNEELRTNSPRESPQLNRIVEQMDIDQPNEKHRKHSGDRKKSRDAKSSRVQKVIPKISLLPKIETTTGYVSHIKNPQEIYIQDISFVTNLDHFIGMCNDVAKNQVKPEDIVTDEMYLMNDSEATNPAKWYRAVVKGRSEKRTYDVQLIDFGNTKSVDKSKIRTCPDVLKNQPRGAAHCCLYNLHPRHGKWTDEVNCLITEMVMSESVMKMTLGIQSEIHVVDLVVMKNLKPLSIRDTLLSVNLAREIPSMDPQMTQLINELRTNIQRGQNARPKFFAPSATVGIYFSPKVIHVESPMEFYVMKHTDIHLYEQQKLAMDHYYENQTRERIYAPEIGAPVAISINDHWFRGEVTEVRGPLQVEVQLVDVGTKHLVNLRSLRMLISDFLKNLPKGVIACSLAHISLCSRYEYQWPAEATEKFSALIASDNIELFVHSENSNRKDMYNVTLYSVRKDKNICINAQLVQMEYAISTGSESVQVEFEKVTDDDSEIEPTSSHGDGKNKSVENAKKSHRLNARILNVISPEEFYVLNLTYMAGFDRVQQIIEKQMTGYVCPEKMLTWKEGDVCFVKTDTAADRICEWRRARVKRQEHAKGGCVVFLLDSGIDKFVKMSDMAQVEDKDAWGACPGAIRCHLSNVEPTAGKTLWPSSAIDKFKKYCTSKKYEGYAVTMMGPFVNGSVPVVLWGRVEEEDPLQPTIVRWKNLNESLVKHGYAHLAQKFPKTFDNELIETEMAKRSEEFEQFIENLNAMTRESVQPVVQERDPLQNELSAKITNVLEWKPAEPWTDTLFVGVSTYVDNNGIIHMYNVQNRARLDTMRLIANQVLHETYPSPVEQFWSKNQPCMAQFSLDNHYYRGIVRKVDKEKSQCLVQFVDYGNIEECPFKIMRKTLLFGNIPIQSYRFRFANIVPMKSDEPWPVEVLDKIHAYTVGNDCTVTLIGTPEETGVAGRIYDMTSLRLGSVDMVKFLIENEMAIPANQKIAVKERKQLECAEPEEKRKKEQEKEPEMKLDSLSKYQEYFKQKELKELLEDDKHSSAESDEIVSSSESESSGPEDDDQMETVSFGDFNPDYVSTEIPEPAVFTTLVVNRDCEGFYGTTTEVISALDLYIYPDLAGHEKMHKDMDKCLQDAAPCYPAVTKVTALTVPYLVRYDEDSRWYRGLVLDDGNIEDEYSVKFVDYLNTEHVKITDIKPLHENLQVVPLRNLRVKLADVKVNQRYRNDDVEKELRKLLHKKRVYVKIVNRDQPLSVQIYGDKEAKVVIYESLINKKFYLRQPKI
ncbi:uncharacterized protein LOC132258378 [Phlebotomus argentipes]|uniref:uncharacterized protein LOC132258378 n=1 Tax=Phlebotomus argentipes TaxID=94469 RepID=UPI0028935013|nr:uncharacterized protein LOC132258378 [Phlebotomus argentipes]